MQNLGNKLALLGNESVCKKQDCVNDKRNISELKFVCYNEARFQQKKTFILNYFVI